MKQRELASPLILTSLNYHSFCFVCSDHTGCPWQYSWFTGRIFTCHFLVRPSRSFHLGIFAICIPSHSIGLNCPGGLRCLRYNGYRYVSEIAKRKQRERENPSTTLNENNPKFRYKRSRRSKQRMRVEYTHRRETLNHEIF